MAGIDPYPKQRKSSGLSSGNISQPAPRTPSVGARPTTSTAPKPPMPGNTTLAGPNLASGNISQPAIAAAPLPGLPTSNLAPTAPGAVITAPPIPPQGNPTSQYPSMLMAQLSPIAPPPIFDMSDFNIIQADPILRQWLQYLTM